MQHQMLRNQDSDFGYNSTPKAFFGKSNNPGYLATPQGPRPPPATQQQPLQRPPEPRSPLQRMDEQILGPKQTPRPSDPFQRMAQQPAPPTSQSQKTTGGIPRTFEGQVDGFNITQQGGVQVIKPSKPDGIDPMDKAKLQLDQQKFAKDVLGQMGDEERGNLRLMASTFQEAVQPAMDGNGPSDDTRAAGLQFGAQLVAAGVDPVMSASAAAQAAQQEAEYLRSQAAQFEQLSAEQQQAAIAVQRAKIQQVMRNLVQPPQQPQPGSDEESASSYPYSPTF